MHIKAFERPGRRPAVGDLVSYAVERDARGRRNAVQPRFAGAKPLPTNTTRVAPEGSGALRNALAVLVCPAFALMAWRYRMPTELLWAYAVISVVTFLAYAWDKAAAQRGAWRTREGSLHALALCGGWPGALLAQGQKTGSGSLFGSSLRSPSKRSVPVAV